MALLFSGLAVVVAVVLLLPTVSDLISLARVAGRRRARPRAAEDSPRLLFLVPAHDEELLIRSCVESLRRLRYPAHRFAVVVIADNCRDQTAALAAAAGARCLERHDPKAPGKPRAIAWALSHLPIADYDAVVIVDADTVADESFAAALRVAAPLRHQAIQTYNDVANPSENAVTRMAAVFATARYRAAYPLKKAAGVNVPLSAGMCLGSEVLATFGWNAFSICEDWELYASLTARGVRIDYVEGARLYAQEARSLRQSATQRQRWAAGKLTVLARYARPLLASRRIGFHQKLDALGELAAPGPAVHLGIVAVLGSVVWLMQPPAAGPLALGLVLPLLRLAVFTTVALRLEHEPGRALLAFAFLPLYALWRFATYLVSFRMLGDQPWIRTHRHEHVPREESSARR